MELYTANCLSTENKPTLELSKLVKDEKSSVKTNSENTLTLVNHGTFSLIRWLFLIIAKLCNLTSVFGWHHQIF